MRHFNILLCVALLGIQSSAALGQWLDYPAAGVPRTHDGKVDLKARAPRTRDGKPDLSGVWHVQSESIEEKRRLFGPQVGVVSVPGMEAFTTSKYARNILLDFKPGEILMTPAAEDIAKADRAVSPADRNSCLPFGIPLAVLLSEVQKIVQTQSLILVMIELDSMTRQIYTDGRKLPQDPSPSWQGYSVGRWEKDTLVVETIGFNGRTVLDVERHPVSQGMHLTERYTRRDVGHLDVAMTFDDPKMYNKPFTVTVTHLLQPDSDILEYSCAENEKDRIHIVR